MSRLIITKVLDFDDLGPVFLRKMEHIWRR